MISRCLAAAAVLVLGGVAAAQTSVRLISSTAAGAPYREFPANAALRCRYYQSIQLIAEADPGRGPRGSASEWSAIQHGSFSGNPWAVSGATVKACHWEAAGAALTGADAEAAMPVFRLSGVLGTSQRSLTFSAEGAGGAFTPGGNGWNSVLRMSWAPASSSWWQGSTAGGYHFFVDYNESSVNAAFGSAGVSVPTCGPSSGTSGTRVYGSLCCWDSFRFLLAGACGGEEGWKYGEGLPQDWSAFSEPWSRYTAGSRATFDGTVLRVYVDAHVFRFYTDTGALTALQIVRDAGPLPTSAEFLWLEYEVVEAPSLLGGGSGLSDTCCAELVTHIDLVTAQVASVGLLLRGWEEAWQDQDTYLRTWLSGGGSVGVPTADAPGAAVLPENPKWGNFKSAAEAAMPSGTEGAKLHTGLSADSTSHPEWSFTLPMNPLEALSGSVGGLGTLTITPDFTPIDPYIFWFRLLMIAFAGIYVMSMVWEELRRY